MLNFFKKEKKEPKNLKEILARFKGLEENLEKISQELENLKKESQFSVKKVGMVRFNPFREVGGDQSFSLALLNDEDSGVVITSLYTREGNRVYGKPIKGGQSEYSLSAEEKEALLIATKNNDQNKPRKSNNSATDSGGPRAY
jgi:N-methylhydantoinase A/oxoprolinase/acetone carboxylase beta subunit